MLRLFHYTIDELHNGQTITEFLKAHDFSHAVIVQLKKTNRGILRNGEWAYVIDRLQTGDVLDLRLEESESSPNIDPIKLPLDILYEDDDILVVNKPARMPVHPSINHHDDALANAVMYYYAQQGIPYVFHCITRLDRDTTGVTLLAKNLYAASILSKSTQSHEIEKTYLAICDGEIPKEGIVEAPIARKEASAILRCIDEARGDYAKTLYHRLAVVQTGSKTDDSFVLQAPTDDKVLSLVELQLETGRTHQIRVHMAHIGHPLIGDFLYHPKDHTMERQALHCYSLGFHHPHTKKWMEFTAPLPDDMAQFFPSITL